jgi:hypothetical protein
VCKLVSILSTSDRLKICVVRAPSEKFGLHAGNIERRESKYAYIICIIVRKRPLGFQDVEAPRFQDSRHMKAVRLSAIRTVGNILGTHFC